MKSSYFSFLLTSHESPKETIVAAYVNGLPLGRLVNGVFQPHGFVYPKGEPVLVRIENLPEPFPFETLDDMKKFLHEAIDKLNVIEEKKEESV